MKMKTKQVQTTSVRLSADDVVLLKAGRRARAHFRPHREAEVAIRKLRTLAEGLPEGVNNPFAHLLSASEQLAARVAMIQETAAEALRRIEKLPSFYPSVFRHHIRKWRAEAKAQTRRARRAA